MLDTRGPIQFNWVMEAINKEEAMRAIFLGLVLLCAAAAPSWAADDGGIFARGDANGDGAFDIGDPVYILRFLFSNGGDGDCLDALDVNDDGQINVADAVSALAFLFGEGPPPPPPLDISRNPCSLRARTGCWSLRIALASTWRTRSRVTLKILPTSSSVYV